MPGKCGPLLLFLLHDDTEKKVNCLKRKRDSTKNRKYKKKEQANNTNCTVDLVAFVCYVFSELFVLEINKYKKKKIIKYRENRIKR